MSTHPPSLRDQCQHSSIIEQALWCPQRPEYLRRLSLWLAVEIYCPAGSPYLTTRVVGAVHSSVLVRAKEPLAAIRVPACTCGQYCCAKIWDTSSLRLCTPILSKIAFRCCCT